MKALLAAGGRATRLRPITHTINKHLIPIANRPMIHYALEKIAETGIKEVAININPGDIELSHALGDGAEWGMKFTYLEQEGGALGLAHIIKNARDRGFLQKGDRFLMYLGDNLILGNLKKFAERFEQENLNCLLVLAKVSDPQRFGVPEIREGRIVRAIEKPAVPPSPYAITGIYFYDDHALDAVETMRPSARGELEITDVHQYYIDRNLPMGYEIVPGWWKDTGKPEDLLEGNQLILNFLMQNGQEHDGTVEVTEGAVIQGNVKIGTGTKIGAHVLIRGPVIIGEHCVIEDAYLGPYTSIGNDVEIHNTEIEHSIVLEGARISAGTRIVDSLVGHYARVISAHDSLPLGHKLVVGDHSVVEL